MTLNNYNQELEEIQAIWWTMLLEGKQNKSKNCIILQFIYSSCDDPNTYDDAIKSEVWRKSMDLEIESIESNNT
jgi:hypothetical protein